MEGAHVVAGSLLTPSVEAYYRACQVRICSADLLTVMEKAICQDIVDEWKELEMGNRSYLKVFCFREDAGEIKPGWTDYFIPQSAVAMQGLYPVVCGHVMKCPIVMSLYQNIEMVSWFAITVDMKPKV